MYKVDFNLIDAFKMFEISGYVTPTSLRRGLDSIGVYPTKSEVQLFFLRYDKNRDEKLNFDEFAQAFLPADNYMAQMLGLRPSNHRKIVHRLDDCFNPETQLQYRHMWITTFKTEQRSAQTLSQLCKECFSLVAAFQNLDTCRRGSLLAQNLTAAFEEMGMHLNQDDAQLLVLRFADTDNCMTLKQIENVILDSRTVT